MKINAEAIHGSRPWKTFGEGPAAASPPAENNAQFNESKRKDLGPEDIRFTTKGNVLFAFAMGWPAYKSSINALGTDNRFKVGQISNVELLGFDGKVEWSQDRGALHILTPAQKPCDYAIVFKITGA
jgi:alpha-L-fucosidase